MPRLTKLATEEHLRDELQKRLAASQPLALLRLDIDDFRIFNYVYGFQQGDRAIETLAQAITGATGIWGGPGDLAAHLGGDDFALLVQPARAAAIAQAITHDFDQQIRGIYRAEDLTRGYVEWCNRLGELTRYPVMTVSIGIATTDRRHFASYLECEEVALEVQRYCKKQPGSTFCLDRRTSAPADRSSAPRAARRDASAGRNGERDSNLEAYVSLIAHELRSPVTLMQMALDVLLAHPGPALSREQTGYLAMAQRSCRRLTRTVTNLATYDALQRQRDSLRSERFDLGGAIAQAVELSQDLAAEKNILLKVDTDAGPIPLLTDELAVIHALWEVVDNAVKFGRPGGTVRISAQASVDEVAIRVADDGPGIPEADLVGIFEEFRQLEDPLTRRSSGLGLGLTLARRLMESLGGSAEVESRPGKGSTFILTLPRRYGGRGPVANSLRVEAQVLAAQLNDHLAHLRQALSPYGEIPEVVDGPFISLESTMKELERLIRRALPTASQVGEEDLREQAQVQRMKAYLLRIAREGH